MWLTYMFLLAQSTKLQKLLVCQLRDPGLQELAASIPHRVIQSRASKTADKYSRAFNEFHLWTTYYAELTSLPALATTVALYLEHLMQASSPYSKLESVVYGIRWVHGLYGWDNPCEATLVRNMLEAGKRTLLKPTIKKEPFTLDMLDRLCTCYASESSNLSELRVATICVTAFYGFLRFSEVSSLRCCDLKFVQQRDVMFVELNILKSKTDVYRDGAKVLLAYNGGTTCPYSILRRYVVTAKLQLLSTDPLFSRLQYIKATKSYKIRGGVLSYTRTREIVLQALTSLGYEKEKFGLHSLRSGGATLAANNGVSDRLFKRHGRWKSETAKDGYVKDSLDALLSVSKSLK